MELIFKEKVDCTLSFKTNKEQRDRLKKHATLKNCTVSVFIKTVLNHYMDILDKELSGDESNDKMLKD